MRARRRNNTHRQENRGYRRRVGRSHSYSSGSTESSPSSTSVEGRNSRTRSSTSELWNTFEPRPFVDYRRGESNGGPFIGNFIHPDVHGYYTPYPIQKPYQLEHCCNHCIMSGVQPPSYGPAGMRELYDQIGHLKPANHHPYMADEELIYQGVVPHNAILTRPDSYHSDFRGYLNRHREDSFESLPDMHHIHTCCRKAALRPSNLPYPGYTATGIPNRIELRPRVPPQVRNHAVSRKRYARPQLLVDQKPFLHQNPNYHYHQAQFPNPYPQQLIFDIPHGITHKASRSHSMGHHNLYRDPFDFRNEARKHSKRKRSPSPDPDEESRSSSSKVQKKDKVKVETIPVRQDSCNNLPLRIQKQLTQRSSFINRQNTNLSDIASPLFNGPPPRSVFAYADPNAHGLTPHPSTRNVPSHNYGQPAWLRYDSFGESPETGNYESHLHGFSGIVREMELTPTNAIPGSRMKTQKSFNTMKKQKTPTNAVASIVTRERSPSPSPKK